jgi:hypothetical protein
MKNHIGIKKICLSIVILLFLSCPAFGTTWGIYQSSGDAWDWQFNTLAQCQTTAICMDWDNFTQAAAWVYMYDGMYCYSDRSSNIVTTRAGTWWVVGDAESTLEYLGVLYGQAFAARYCNGWESQSASWYYGNCQ